VVGNKKHTVLYAENFMKKATGGMVKYYIHIIIALLVILPITLKAQQGALFSQYMFNGLYINPAYSGYKEVPNIQALNRIQWAGVEGSPETLSIAVDGNAQNGNVGLSMMVFNDKVGAESNLTMYANYAYRLKVGEVSRLALGIGVGFSQYSIDGDELGIENDDPSIPKIKESTIVPDIRIGVFYSSNLMYFGLSMDNLIGNYLTYPKDLLIPIPIKNPHIYFTGGGIIPLTPKFLLKPSFLYKTELSGPSSIDLNASVLFANRIWFGTGFRVGMNGSSKSVTESLSMTNAIILMTDIYVTTDLRLGYSYDYGLNRTHNFNSGAHEIALGYLFRSKNVRTFIPRYF